MSKTFAASIMVVLAVADPAQEDFVSMKLDALRHLTVLPPNAAIATEGDCTALDGNISAYLS